MVLRILLIPKGHKKEMKRRKTRQRKLKREKRRKRFEVFFGVWNEQCELSIYRENSQLLYEKLWEQVIQY